VRIWTDEEISTLVSMWPTSTAAQIAPRLRRSCGAIRLKAKQLRKEGLLKDKKVLRSRLIKPNPQDFDEVKRDYCRKHHITIAELCARFERDNQLAAELYRLAQAVKLALKGGR
jgi:transposase